MLLYLSWLGDLKHPVHLLLTAVFIDPSDTYHTTQASHGEIQRRHLTLKDSARALLAIFFLPGLTDLIVRTAPARKGSGVLMSSK